ncbi:c-type cytochrome [Roseibium sp.]|uniref:c-type cytochrome n=1 Tax=Roseibium sp. TaxID=1936156 RepID=UPI003A970F49
MWSRLPAAAIAGFVLIAGLAWRFIEAQPEDVADYGTPLVSVEVPKLQGAAREGEALFNDKCASCHGRNAAGQEGVAPPLVHRIYEPNHHGDGAFLIAALQGVRAHHWPFGNMPPVPGVTPDDVGKIVAYVRTLQKANGIF